MGKVLEPSREIERSIMKKYRKELWNPFIQAVKNYELVQENDKIAVCISGGKDSMLMAKLMQLLQRYGDVPFELVFLVMDPGYNERNRNKIEQNAKLLEIPVTIFETNIFEVANSTMAAQVRKTFVVQLPVDVLHVLCHVKYDLGHVSALHRGAGAKSLR